jgi:peptide deformylase
MRIVPQSEVPVANPVLLDNPLEVYKVCKQLEIVCKYEGGVGLSAVQVGLPMNLFIVRGQSESNPFVQPGRVGCFVNCEYTGIEEDGKIISLEGCLSLKKDGKLRFFRLERYNTIFVKGFQLTDNLEFVRIEAQVKVIDDGAIYQHEADHGKQIFISDLGEEIFLY